MEERTFSHKAARIISTIMVPPSFTILIFIYFAFSLETSTRNIFLVIAVALSFGFLFQILMFFFFRRRGMIADMDASVKEERTLPFFVAVVIYLCGLIVLIQGKVNPLTVSFWFCYISNTLIVIFINRHWKISAHALGAAGPLGALAYMLGIKSILFFLILPVIGWARLKLERHTLAQVVAGSIVGFLFTYFQISFLIGYFG